MIRARTGAMILALLPAALSAADIAPPQCPEPERPEVVKTVEEYNEFARAALAYRTCLLDYAGEQKKISDAHGAAANAAIKRWNTFAAQRPPAPSASGQGNSGS